ncbi:MAG: S41 family peptidase [Dehalococcoidia bacterium]
MHDRTAAPPRTHRPRTARWAWLCALLLAALLPAACASSGATKTPAPSLTATVVTSTPAGPAATPTPDPAVLLKDGGIAIIQTAYTRLLDEYISPPDAQALLDAAWQAAARKARALGAAVPAAPAFTGDRTADLAAFSDAYVRMTAGLADARDARFAAISAMAGSLHDCHTFFLNPVASDTVVGSREGKGSVGIGVQLAGVPPLVTEVIPGGPAARAGILVGDRIVSINGVDASSMGLAAAFDLINGAAGTAVRLRLRRPATGAMLDVTMQRERVVPPNIESRVLPNRIGYVRLREFIDGGVADGLRDALTAFDAQAVTKWIIDIRGNPGGRLDVNAISLFVKDGVIVRDQGRDGKPQEVRADGNVLPALRPTVLLVDNGTGSVAEVFAAALQEYRAAYVVGATTNGCVGYTDLRPLGDGSSLAVTTNVNQGPLTGKPLNGVGVVPDEPVARTATDIAAGRDPQLDAAIAHLEGVSG